MVWWKAALVNVLALSGAAAFTCVAVRGWLDRRQQVAWPVALATVTAHKQGPGYKGRSATYLVGHHGSSEFTVKWDLSDLSSGGWTPPPQTPAVGSTVRVHVDPRNPSVVALADGPRVPTAVGTFGYLALVDVVAVAVSIAVWFI
jgi:hypothetical protein